MCVGEWRLKIRKYGVRKGLEEGKGVNEGRELSACVSAGLGFGEE
jgi:hypothetical protein